MADGERARKSLGLAHIPAVMEIRAYRTELDTFDDPSLMLQPITLGPVSAPSS